ncbi:MAG: hypothetical protein NE330_04385 [Lentisphaeraceae bacterium]|nr:hypothetical protein [Lentisphaeraceae bacterium]
MLRPALLLICFFISTLQGFAQNTHGNRGDFAVYDPSGKYIAVAGTDLILLNRKNDEVKVLNEYAPGTTAAEFSKDGKLLAAQTKDFGIYVYDISGNEEPVFFQGLKKQAIVQNRFLFSPDKTMLATSNSEKVVIYNLQKGNEGKVLLTITIDPRNSNRTVAAFDASDDWKTFFFNMQMIELENKNGKLSYKYGRVLTWNKTITNLSDLSPDGSKVVVTGRNGLNQRLYDTKTGASIASMKETRTYSLTSNKDFSKIYMNQMVWDLKAAKAQIIYQPKNINKSTKRQISVAPDNGEFMIGLYQFNSNGSLKADLQSPVTVLDRCEINGDFAKFYKDNSKTNRYDAYSASISEGLKGRSSRNLINNKNIKSTLATHPSGEYGINFLGRIARKSSMTISSPVFSLQGRNGIAAAISESHIVAFANQSNVYLYDLSEEKGESNKGKALKTFKLPNTISRAQNPKLAISPNGKFIGLTFEGEASTQEYGLKSQTVQLFDIQGKLIKSVSTNNVGTIAFSNNSERFYYSSGKQLICYTSIEVEGNISWDVDEAFSWYTESGNITSIALSKDDSLLAYTADNGHNKVVKASYGNQILKCIIGSNASFTVSK